MSGNSSKLKTSLAVELGIVLFVLLSLYLANMGWVIKLPLALLPLCYAAYRIRWYFQEKKKGFTGPYESFNDSGGNGFH